MRTRKLISLLISLLAMAALVPTPLAQAGKAPFRVVIDPGHGGTDEGTVSNHHGVRVTEKDVTLLLAIQTAKKLRTHGFQVFLTRESDQSLSLSARTALANRMKADAFISIHMNSTPHPGASDAFGIETYFLNSTSDDSSKRLAHFENSVLGGSAAENSSSEGLDVALILKDLRLDANLSESKRLACHLQHHLVQFTSARQDEVVATSPRNRGIKQALFYVLLGADMPAVLVEAGFLSHAKDRETVLSAQGQERIASAITASLERFRTLKGTRQAQQVVSTCKVH